MKEKFRLELIRGAVERTTWWKDENHPEPANVWWLYGPGTSRLATHVEVDLWLQLLAEAGRGRRAKKR
jgi:hypothetical protein